MSSNGDVVFFLLQKGRRQGGPSFCWLLNLPYYPRRRYSHVGRVCSSVCVFVCLVGWLVFHTISQKPINLGSSNVTQKCSTMSPGNSFTLGSKSQRSRSRGTKAQKQCRHGSRRACECWLIYIYIFNKSKRARGHLHCSTVTEHKWTVCTVTDMSYHITQPNVNATKSRNSLEIIDFTISS